MSRIVPTRRARRSGTPTAAAAVQVSVSEAHIPSHADNDAGNEEASDWSAPEAAIPTMPAIPGICCVLMAAPVITNVHSRPSINATRTAPTWGVRRGARPDAEGRFGAFDGTGSGTSTR